MKYYGIIKGNQFEYVRTWEECRKKVYKVKKVKYKSFTDYDSMMKWKNDIFSMYSNEYNLDKGVVLYSDGGSNTIDGKPRKKGSKSTNTDRSAWAYVIVKDGKKLCEGSGFNWGFTNNKQELQGAYRGLEKLQQLELDNDNVLFVTDSMYVINSINYNDKPNPDKPNMKQVLALSKKYKEFSNIRIQWVKGHSVTEWNNRCDELCSIQISNHLTK